MDPLRTFRHVSTHESPTLNNLSRIAVPPAPYLPQLGFPHLILTSLLEPIGPEGLLLYTLPSVPFHLPL